MFLSIATLPLLRGLERLGVPTLIGIPIVVVLAAGALVGVISIFKSTVGQFGQDIAAYEVALNQLVTEDLEWLALLGITAPEDLLRTTDLVELLTPTAVMGFVTTTVTGVIAVLGRGVIVVVTLTFILLEATELEHKLKVAFGTDSQPAGPFAGAGEKVTRYLLIKTIVSAITGVAAGLLCRFAGLEFWVMWGVIAFMLNYIPTIGSILAAIPPMLLALVQIELGPTLGIGAGYVIINVALGNFIEPRLMGQSLGLSPLIVFLSLVFWGWLWGPVGMLLCVPLTVMAKLVLESNDETRWLAVLLGSSREVRQGGPPPRLESIG